MIKLNENYKNLQASYLFANIADKVKKYTEANPDNKVIKLGIGDVTFPLTPAVIKGFHEGVDEMADEKTFQGYPPYEGFAFLREAIAEHDFKSRGVDIDPSEVFVSDGAKSDSSNIQELFGTDITVAVPDPVYPVYVDTNVMSGRSGLFKNGRYENFIYLDSTPENGYIPAPGDFKADLIYLCYPNNPTGAAATKQQLQEWVDYARKNKALILFDAAYVAFIRDENIPHSIYELEGAKEVAIEIRSYSKTAGFTGTRCGYTIIPKECMIYDTEGNKHALNPLWFRRIATKFNGVSYPVQKAAAAIYTPEGKKQVKELTDYYLENAKIIRKALTEVGYSCTGGDNSPYIWVKTDGDSWDFFDRLLEEAEVVVTPGSGFGRCGEGHIRISAFNHRDKVEEAVQRILKVLK